MEASKNMTKEELLSPRYKVTAKHSPFNAELDRLYPIGFIIEANKNLEGATFLTKTILDYPHIFKPLNWYQDRNIAEMPVYLKAIRTSKYANEPEIFGLSAYKEGFILKAFEYRLDENDKYGIAPINVSFEPKNNWIKIDDVRLGAFHSIRDFEPATEQEYNDFLTAKK
jgi:hypothetical protein